MNTVPYGGGEDFTGKICGEKFVVEIMKKNHKTTRKISQYFFSAESQKNLTFEPKAQKKLKTGTPPPCLTTTKVAVRPGVRKKCGPTTPNPSKSCGPTTRKRNPKTKKINEILRSDQGLVVRQDRSLDKRYEHSTNRGGGFTGKISRRKNLW